MQRRPLLDWLSDPSAAHGIHFATQKDEWDFWPYTRLACLAGRVATGLEEAGLRREEVVSIVGCQGPQFVAALVGTMLAGGIPSPTAPPAAFQGAASYEAYLVNIIEAARPSVLIEQAGQVGRILPAAVGAGALCTTVEELTEGTGDSAPMPHRKPAKLALVQFTSGSTGRGRGIHVSFEALESNVAMIRRWLHWTPEDPFAVWLPLYHDMGLIGGLISSFVAQSDLWLLQPSQFVRCPLRYLRCFGQYGATLTVTPTFGLDLILRKIRPEDLEAFDFSGWKGMVVGAERIEATVLRRWCHLLGPLGFRQTAVLPAYGLAEATLAVTGLPIGEAWTSAAIDAASLSMGRETTASTHGEPSQEVVGCGRPLDGVSVTVREPGGECLREGMVGEVVVQGPSVNSTYNGGQGCSFTSFSNGRLHTGDAGFLRDGQLFVLGRIGDCIKVRGRVVFAEDVEIALAELGIPRLRTVALLGAHEGEPCAVVLVERPRLEWIGPAERVLRLHAGGAKTAVVEAPKGTIQRTSSGKPKRRLLWREFLDGRLKTGPLAWSFTARKETGESE